MSKENVSQLSAKLGSQLNLDPDFETKSSGECDVATSTDSEEYLSEPMGYNSSLLSSTSSQLSTSTLTPITSTTDQNGNADFNPAHIQIPIVGYEVMEERARFTVYKLRVENKASGDCWYVFRRYTDFVRLCNRLKRTYPQISQYLPRKRWLRNNFDPLFLDQRVNGLQVFVNAILNESTLVLSPIIQDFFCLNEPPVYSESNEESRAMFEALEDTIYQLKQQLKEKDQIIDALQDKLHSKSLENENLTKRLQQFLPQDINSESELK